MDLILSCYNYFISLELNYVHYFFELKLRFRMVHENAECFQELGEVEIRIRKDGGGTA
jgi:hypothetical protein